MARKITLADVARRCGLSVSAVSFVLSNRPDSRIPEATAERVRAAARELGYAPDRNARGLRTGRSEALGFISDEVTVTRYASAMIRGILDASEASSHAVLMAETDHQAERVEHAVEVMLSRRIDGLLLGLMRARKVDLPSSMGDVPTLVVNGVADGFGCVLPDEFAAGQESVRYLLERGHRRMALVGRAGIHLDPYVSVTIGRRIAGIDQSMADAGLSFVHEVEGSEWEPDLGYRGAQEILEAGEATAILAANDRIAFGVYQAVQERGLEIARDVSVLSFDDEQLATYLRPQVTTMRLPYQEMGHAAADLLLAAIACSEQLPEELLVPMPIMERGSVRDLR